MHACANLLSQWAAMAKDWVGGGGGRGGPCKRCGRMDRVLPRKVQSDELDNDVIEVVSVSSDSDVVPCFPLPDCSLRFDSRKAFASQVAGFTTGQERHVAAEAFSLVRDSVMSAHERLFAPSCLTERRSGLSSLT